ncbi:MAG TPA: hypothetical protein VGU71_02360 [Candidatus Dormibacteraeota bacterium]|nr:hypothetical protein [Candidatus Dormibacteraeota bacterium]
MKTFRVLAIAALAALMQFSCSTSPGPQASAPRLSSSSPVVVNPADSKAADLRTRLDLLLGEHVMVIAKESAAAASHNDEYTGYLSLLTSATDLTDLMRSAFGDTAAGQFQQLWSVQDGYLVDYTIGLVTHNQNKSNGAISGLINGFVPQFSQFVATTTQLPLDPTTQLMTEQVLETQKLIDDQIAQHYPQMYTDLRTAYAQASRIGDALAPKIARKFPDKFPGDPSNKASDLRVSLNDLLEEHAYLATMASDAAIGGRAAEQSAAAKALSDNADAIGTLFSGLFSASAGTQFDQLWAAKDAAMAGYAVASDAAAKQSALSMLTDTFVSQFSGFVHDATGARSITLSPAIQSQIAATLKAIDDQKAKTFAPLAADDRTAAAGMQSIADLITAATAAKLPAKFG